MARFLRAYGKIIIKTIPLEEVTPEAPTIRAWKTLLGVGQAIFLFLIKSII